MIILVGGLTATLVGKNLIRFCTTYEKIARVHEEGHVQAVKIAAKRLGQDASDVKYVRTAHGGLFAYKTTSKFFKYLAQHKNEPAVQEEIRRIAAAGIAAEDKFIRTANPMLLQAVDKLAIMYARSLRENSSDREIMVHPEKFEYHG